MEFDSKELCFFDYLDEECEIPFYYTVADDDLINACVEYYAKSNKCSVEEATRIIEAMNDKELNAYAVDYCCDYIEETLYNKAMKKYEREQRNYEHDLNDSYWCPERDSSWCHRKGIF